jgi:hypothetical protein
VKGNALFLLSKSYKIFNVCKSSYFRCIQVSLKEHLSYSPCLYASTSAARNEEAFLKFDRGTFTKIFGENPSLVKTEEKYRALYMKT